jgi:hypothetical protein
VANRLASINDVNNMSTGIKVRLSKIKFNGFIQSKNELEMELQTSWRRMS